MSLHSTTPGLKQSFLHNVVLCHRFIETNTTEMVIPESLKSTVLENMQNKLMQVGVAKTMSKVKERF